MTWFKKFFLIASLFISASVFCQNDYLYTVDLTRLNNDELTVELRTPAIKQSSIVFSFPKIIPGTYSVADYGQFIKNVKAFNKAGKALPVKKLNANQWQITNATQLNKITYVVDDIFDAEKQHSIYPMAATNFEEGQNVALNTPGVFGFFELYRKLPFNISFTKPTSFYASTSLQPVTTTATKDVFLVQGVDALYDAPIMYSLPDTSTVRVANCEVLVSVYSPNKLIQAKQIKTWLADLLNASAKYLGGKLPADKYAFLFYFKDPKLKHSFQQGLAGALEHATSSFYYLYEAPPEYLKSMIVDIASHEFFHIITPLTIASKEVKEFNFHEPVLSKHLWLYEGSTEYTAHHVQVKYGLKTIPEFLKVLENKITYSKNEYKDSLPFTELSKLAASKHANQYGNVYEKGALITAALDIYLHHLSNGSYSFRDLTRDLGIRYGRNRYFEDDELFDAIAELTYPEIKDFLQKYVAGPTPIPYELFFGLAGIQYTPKAERQVTSMGGIAMVPNEKGVVYIQSPFNPNDFGKKMGYKEGDEVYTLNGVKLAPSNYIQVITDVRFNLKDNAPLVVKVGRKNSTGGKDTITLSAPSVKVPLVEYNKLSLIPSPTAQQLALQRAWLTTTSATATKPTRPAANPADVATIDAIVNTIYNVISGPAGTRDWNRFFSLYLPEGQMGAVVPSPNGPVFRAITPESYQRSNGPFFEKQGFFEEELKRNVKQYGNVAMVESSYQFRFTPGGKIEQRGVNYMTLVKSNGRWWVVSLVWQPEEKDLPLPKELEK